MSIERISRENGFNHEKLRELVDGRKKTAISYNDHPKAYELYDGFHIQPIRRGSDGRQELLILSHDIAEQVQPKQLDYFKRRSHNDVGRNNRRRTCSTPNAPSAFIPIRKARGMRWI